jgi:PAS domain S-box-containing protein
MNPNQGPSPGPHARGRPLRARLTYGTDGTILGATPAAVRLFGGAADGIEGRPITELFLEPGRSRLGRLLTDMRAGRARLPAELELLLERADTSAMAVRARIGTVESGPPPTFGLDMHAVTVGLDPQVGMRFFELALELLTVLEMDGRILRVNPAFTSALGLAQDELGTVLLEDLVHPDDRETVRASIERLGLGDAVEDFEVRVRTREGEWRRLEWSAVPDLERGLVLAAARDVTVQREAERQLASAKQLAEEATAAKSEFLASVSHEIRTPMNGVLGMLELLRHTVLDGEQRGYAQHAIQSARGLLRIIDDLLDISRIEAGRLELEETPFRLREAIRESLKGVAAPAYEKGLALSSRVAPDVVDAVVGDVGRLRQVLLNLLGNAVKFTSGGHVQVHVRRVPDAGPHQALEIEVRDSGIGIAAADLDQIFQPFEQADDAVARRMGGTGLGLAISSRFIEAMGGRLTVRSEPGAGSTFTVRLSLPMAPDGEAVEGDPRLAGRVAALLLEDDLEADELSDWMVALGMSVLRREEAAEADVFLTDATKEEDVPAAWRAVPRLLYSVGGLVDSSRTPSRSEVLLRPASPSDLCTALLELIAATPVRPLTVPGRPARPLAILLAEDNPMNRLVAERLLEKRGHRVHCVEDGLAAVEAARSATYDLVLLDIQMPRMGGLEAAARIRADAGSAADHGPWIAALTARAYGADMAKGMAAGMDSWLAKPLDVKRLDELLRMVAGRR